MKYMIMVYNSQLDYDAMTGRATGQVVADFFTGSARGTSPR